MDVIYIVNKPVHFVYEHLSDMQKFASVHPVIFKIEELKRHTYKVYETLKFGFIPITFTYHAVVNANEKEQKVIINATVLKFTQIEMQFNLKSIINGTEVHETVKFKSLFPIKLLMEKIFKEQHRKLFFNFENKKSDL